MLISIHVELIPEVLEQREMFQDISTFLELSHERAEVVGKDKMIIRLVDHLEV